MLWKKKKSVLLTFMPVFPLIWLTLLWRFKWIKAEEKLAQQEKRIKQAEKNQENYKELLEGVRIFQHGIKNHFLAIHSFHYTCHTYEKLVQAQRGYCAKLEADNRFSCLLKIANQQLAGFLYAKLQEIEKEGIRIECMVHTALEKLAVPEYVMIELLGILLDNAAEAQGSSREGDGMEIHIKEKGDFYCFCIGNQFPYVSLEEIIGWFNKEVSSKGEGRGLGLYRIRKLCEEWDCRIIFENRERKGRNWIEFRVEAKKS
ncbi:MAG: sensor histidine kinase [Lachnospiraceae bacterium]